MLVPILTYHRVADVPEGAAGWHLAVPPTAFAAQVAWLAGAGWQGFALRDLAAALLGHQRLPPRSVVFTFDGASRDVCSHALGTLMERSFSGTVFAAPELVGGQGRAREPLASWEGLRAAAAAGFEIGSQGARHVSLAGRAPEDLAREIDGSHAAIAERLRIEPLTFAYPYGAFDARACEAVERAGYLAAVSTERGVCHSRAMRFRLRRVPVSRSVTVARLARRLTRLYDLEHRVKRFLRRRRERRR